ncbi:hypothetical protein CEXT_714271 [Caerostris extrusa]|uniref:Ribosomal subunit interface protein n=1 Tax=Caerostris extrusa TaxID=172846 RepID=A0AAV4N627_CAEEX|nr:hypothetical protein CEXT_714271 [Caerostris extrusa]
MVEIKNRDSSSYSSERKIQFEKLVHTVSSSCKSNSTPSATVNLQCTVESSAHSVRCNGHGGDSMEIGTMTLHFGNSIDDHLGKLAEDICNNLARIKIYVKRRKWGKE